MAAALQQSISSSLWRPLSHRGLQLSVDLHEFTVAESNSNMKGLVTTVECLYQEATDDALFDEEPIGVCLDQAVPTVLIF